MVPSRALGGQWRAIQTTETGPEAVRDSAEGYQA